MKKFTLILILFMAVLSASAQKERKDVAQPMDREGIDNDTAKAWTTSGFASLNISQASFTNWAAGGQNSVGFNAFLNYKADYKHKHHSWKNNLDVAYGFQFLGKGSDAQFTKTDDRIEYTTSYGYAIAKHWDLTLLLNLRTQMTNGYNYPDDSTVISKIMAPGYMVAGIGVNYVPANYFMVYMSPSAGRFTFVLDKKLSDAGAFGVTPGQKYKAEFGPYIRAVFAKDLIKNVNLNTNLELFTDYFGAFGNIDVNWNLLLTLKVNKWLAASIATQLIYDDDIMITDKDGNIGPRTQFKEVIGVGLTYKFL